MTIEEFKHLALNPPMREEDTIFELWEYDVAPLPERRRNHYPKFDVRERRVGFGRTLDEAERLIKVAIAKEKEYDTEIYCFHIREFPIGEYDIANFGVSARLYDSQGKLLDKTYCSSLSRDWHSPFGSYRGRSEEALRFKEGDIVEVLYGDEVRLGVVTSRGLTIEWCWDLRERLRNDRRFKTADKPELTDEDVERIYILDDTDDQITIIDAPTYVSHDHVSPLCVMPLRYPLSNKLRKRFESYYKSCTEE